MGFQPVNEQSLVGLNFFSRIRRGQNTSNYDAPYFDKQLNKEHDSPVAAGNRPGCKTVGHCQQEQHLQKILILDDLGHLNRGFFIAQVPALGNMSEQQMLSHKKRDYLKGFSFDAESIQNLRDEPGAFPGMIFPIPLPDIVKEGGQKKPMSIFQFFKGLSEQGPFFIIRTL